LERLFFTRGGAAYLCSLAFFASVEKNETAEAIFSTVALFKQNMETNQ
jgi:hypothetical protein